MTAATGGPGPRVRMSPPTGTPVALTYPMGALNDKGSMSRGRTIWTVVLVTVAVSALIALAAVLGASALGHNAGTPAARFWWVMPLVAAAVIGGVTWLLLLETPKREQRTGGSPDVETCPDCGREVAAGWRLCPWCGARPERHGRES